MADRPEAPDISVKANRDDFGEITTKTKDLRPYNQAKERRLEMDRLLQFFRPMECKGAFCPVCGNRKS